MDPLNSHEKHPEGSVKKYIMGFVLSLILTFASYFSVYYRLFSPVFLLFTILALALVQTVIQLVLFLHLGEESKPHRNLLTFLFMLSILIIVIWGSIWIMNHLQYNMMSHMTQLTK
jgi:cytochrome o ubiquinol oxidase operon protein cyoD